MCKKKIIVGFRKANDFLVHLFAIWVFFLLNVPCDTCVLSTLSLLHDRTVSMELGDGTLCFPSHTWQSSV